MAQQLQSLVSQFKVERGEGEQKALTGVKGRKEKAAARKKQIEAKAVKE